MAFLGMDQSLNGTGLCLLSREREVKHLSTVAPGKRVGPERLAFIKSSVAALLEANVVFVSMEGYSYNSVGRVFELGEVGGVLKLLIFESNLPLLVVPPASLKLFAAGNANAEKEDMVAAAEAAGVGVSDDNQADAYFLALISWFLQTGAEPETRAQGDVLHALKEPPPKKKKRRIRRLIKNAL